MSAGSVRCLDSSKHILLSWSEPPDSPSREEVVEIIQADSSEAIVYSSLRLKKDTRVFLRSKSYSESGIVRSCLPDGNRFMLTISIGPESPANDSGFDPGVFAVESFLTEEQEAQILKDLDDELSRFSLRRVWQHFRSLILLPFPA